MRGAVLVTVLALLLLLDSSCAQRSKKPAPGHPKNRKISDPHYRHQQQYGQNSKGYGGYNNGYAGYKPYDGKDYQGRNKPYEEKDYGEYDKYGQYNSKYGGSDRYEGYYEADGTQGTIPTPGGDPDGGYHNEGYGDYKGYGSGGGDGQGPQLSAKDITLDAQYCTVKFPGVGSNTDFKPPGTTDYISRPSTVVGWIGVTCGSHKGYGSYDYRYGYDKDYDRDGYDEYPPDYPSEYNSTYDEYDEYNSTYRSYGYYGKKKKHHTGGTIGDCWFKAIKYKFDKTHTYPAFMTFFCHLNAHRAKKCDHRLHALDDDKIIIGGHGRVTFGYMFDATQNPDNGVFSITKDKWEEELLVTGYYNGQAQGGGQTQRLLPLTRFNVGLARFNVHDCFNANPSTSYPDGYYDPTNGLQQSFQTASGDIAFDLTI